jgi:Helix-turn-helix.
MKLGDIIADYRRQNGLSMEKFAEISGISKGYVSMLERNVTQRGEEPSPSFEKYRAVAKTIGIDVDELIRMVEGKISLLDNEKEPTTMSRLLENPDNREALEILASMDAKTLESAIKLLRVLGED